MKGSLNLRSRRRMPIAPFCHRSNETIATAVLGLDDLLLPATVPDGFACLGHTLRECRFANNNIRPQLLDQLLSRNKAFTVTNQVHEEIEYFGFDFQHVIGTAELVALIVECELIEEVNHGL